jgi:hypothetical protein
VLGRVDVAVHSGLVEIVVLDECGELVGDCAQICARAGQRERVVFDRNTENASSRAYDQSPQR